MVTSPSATAALSQHYHGLAEQLGIAASAICHPLQSWKWQQLLKTHPLLSELAPLCPALSWKIHHRYLSRHLGCVQRAALLETHYDFLLGAGFSELVQQAMRQPVPICTFIGKSNVLYRLELSTANGMINSGEMLLRLTSRGLCIYTIAFVFSLRQGQRYVVVGGLSGMLSCGRDAGVRRITRDLYGCRPKDLMVSLVREMGAFFHCKKIILVCNRNKVPAGRKRICRKSADVDRHWMELQAPLRPDGDYELPCSASVPARAGPGITPKKRDVLVHAIRVALRRRLAMERSEKRSVTPASSMRA